MTGKTQSEAVSILRSVRLGGVVNLVLSRQDSGSAAATPEKVLPRELVSVDSIIPSPIHDEVN